MSFCNSTSSKDYYIKRIRRIYPAYAFVILCSACVGFLLTSYSFKDYFSPDLVKFLLANLTFLNLLQPSLPGVFQNNTLSAVNGALWTIRFEVLFYLIIPFLSFSLRKYGKKTISISMIIILILTVYFSKQFSESMTSAPISLLVKLTPELFFYFICGSLLYHLYNDIHHWLPHLFILSILIYIVGKVLGFSDGFPICISIIVLVAACRFPYLGNWGKYGDFSYGIYIWHFPVLQTFISFNLFHTTPFLSLFASFIIILLLAWISWHLIEKRFLRRTSHYIQSTKS